MSEATIKASKRKTKSTSLNEEVIDGSGSLNEPIENYNISEETSMLLLMRDKALQNKQNAEDAFAADITVSDIFEYGEDTDLVKYFEIQSEDKGYVVYQIIDRIYYKDYEEFYNTKEDFSDEVPGQFVEALKRDYLEDKEMPSCSVLDTDNCMFVISSIFIALTGESFDNDDEIIESAKIRRNTSVSADNELNKSKEADEAKNGTKDANDFKQEIEDKQKADGTIGALDQQQEEAYEPKLPNVHMLKESNEIEFEVRDKVICDDQIWYVIAVDDTLDYGQILTITREGQTLRVPASAVKPKISDLERYVIDLFDLNDKTRLNNKPENEEPVKMEDYNDQSIFCNVKFDNVILEHTIDDKRFRANLKDLMEEADPVRVYIGDEILEIPKDDIIICDDQWPYAVIVNAEDEPTRKIRVNPTSFINAKEDTDLVDCMIGDKHTELPKHAIRMLS